MNLSLEEDQLFQKFVGRAATKQHEVRFVSLDLDYVGFVTGLDEDWIQLTLTGTDHKSPDRLASTLLRLSNLSAVSETGRTVADLSENEAAQVRSFTSLFRKISQAETRSA